jgi:hypothetical protein
LTTGTPEFSPPPETGLLAFALAVAWAGVRRLVIGRGGMPTAQRELLARRQQAMRRHRKGAERSRRRNRASP